MGWHFAQQRYCVSDSACMARLGFYVCLQHGDYHDAVWGKVVALCAGD